MAAGFNPGSFSFVMATGIVSIAALQWQMNAIAEGLFVVNLAAYAALVLLMVLRSVLYPGLVLSDMTSPTRAPGFFTVTAATCILGSQVLLLSGALSAGIVFSFAGLFFWAVLSYAFFTSVIVKEAKMAGEEGLSGEWLIYVVGTQSLAITSILLSAHPIPEREEILLVALCLHLVGIAVYVALIVLIVRRMLFLSLPPDSLSPPYWINMGAAAISTLAGAELIRHAGSWSLLRTILPAITWTTLMLWSITTWWIPLIVILNVWRYGFRRYPITYDVQHWSMVFPLGMYAACTFQSGITAGLAPLLVISHYFYFVALAAWITVFLGMVSSALRWIRSAAIHRSFRNS